MQDATRISIEISLDRTPSRRRTDVTQAISGWAASYHAAVHVLIVNRYYLPDFEMPHAIARRFAEDGHGVTVFTGPPIGADNTPTHKTVVDGVQLIRVWMPRLNKATWRRLRDMVVFAAKLAWHLLRHGSRYDIVIASSSPPLSTGAAASALAGLKRFSFVYHCPDIYPEVLMAPSVATRSRLARVAARVDTWVTRHATAVVVLSSDMAETIRERGIPGHKVRIIPNFITYETKTAPLPPELQRTNHHFRVLFAGNVGLVQGLDTVIEAARELEGERSIEFLFVGDGAARDSLQEQAKDLIGGSVRFFPRYPIAEVNSLMKECDLGLVALAPRVHRVAFPSKVMAYLVAGCPILAVVEGDSDLADLVEKNGLGWVAEPNDPRQLAETIRTAFASRASRDPSRLIEVAYREFGPDNALGRWSSLISEIGSLA